MRKKRPVYLRVMAGITAIIIIGVIAFITNAFTGNPISAHFAKKHMISYATKKYPDMDLSFSKTEYNFKTGGYTIKASNANSIDTHFMVNRRSDGYIYDGYENYVLGGFNTLDRLGKEMTKDMEPLLKELFKNELSGRLFADCIGDKKNLEKGAPPLNTPYNRVMKLNATIYMDFDLKNPTIEEISDRIQKADKLLKKEGFSVGGYVVEALNRDTKKGYMVTVYADIINEKFPEVMKNAFDNNNNSEGVSITAVGK
ncbi:hypothetical protein SAMN05444401_0978 [Clostridium amylolyticum]|uniref:Uncharacterized protein n=1 Tax=Clostridium amylolyticum TaxID=1121298 RepID=A0A1M6C2F6_9CLOT|nr:hypothetical protein [Clostridium amylolyticum]SHI55235.1 hypothetical protein SAMN05444401_0978 [Clostridium amylolyticum]